MSVQIFTSQLNAIKANDEKTLQQLYSAVYPNVEHYILLNSGTTDQAKDIFQEAFIAMWRNVQLGKFQPQGENSITAYLFQIAKNKWMDHLRSANVNKTVSLKENHQDLMTFESYNDKDTERLASIKESYKKLGNSCKELLTRFYYKKQSLKEIADALEWTEATAKNNKYRCMERLRNMMTK